jgi:hypothetical protein
MKRSTHSNEMGTPHSHKNCRHSADINFLLWASIMYTLPPPFAACISPALYCRMPATCASIATYYGREHGHTMRFAAFQPPRSTVINALEDLLSQPAVYATVYSSASQAHLTVYTGSRQTQRQRTTQRTHSKLCGHGKRGDDGTDPREALCVHLCVSACEAGLSPEPFMQKNTSATHKHVPHTHTKIYRQAQHAEGTNDHIH